MTGINAKISVTNTSISNFERLKNVHNARQNLQKVITNEILLVVNIYLIFWTKVIEQINFFSVLRFLT